MSSYLFYRQLRNCHSRISIANSTRVTCLLGKLKLMKKDTGVEKDEKRDTESEKERSKGNSGGAISF